ncbi:MAG: response regulator [candidate division Zixibacteria bacterium]|nr:response regulator [candidate division Zixibacteria bacterium]
MTLSGSSSGPRPYDLLVVDDEPLVRDVLQELFEGEGYTVHVAADIPEAEEILNRETIAVALVDLKLSHSDGIHVLDCIKKTDPAVSVILMTGHPTLESVIDALQHGAFNYIIKPFRLHELRSTVRTALGEFDKERRYHFLSQRLCLLERILKDHGIAFPDWAGEKAAPPKSRSAAADCLETKS